MSFDYIFKFITVGECSVGKSSIMLQFIDKRFNSEHNTTIGVEFGARSIEINRRIIKIQIWDTAGQERFRSITRAYYKDACAVLLIYDVTKEDTFMSLHKWLDDIKDMTNNPLIFLIGNKVDLPNRAVTYEQGKDFAIENGMRFIETSAKNSINIEEVFTSAAKNILRNIDAGLIDVSVSSNGIKKNNKTNMVDYPVGNIDVNKELKKNSGCCSK